MEYFKCLVIPITCDGKCACEVKSMTFMSKAAFKKKKKKKRRKRGSRRRRRRKRRPIHQLI